MKKCLFGIIAILLVALYAEYQQVKFANSKWETAMANVKAYSEELASTGDRNVVLQLTVNQLEYFKDSVLRELDATRKQLKVKDKNLKALLSASSSFSKSDTVYLDSIVFKEPDFALDTLIGDEWYSLRLGLKYPSMVAVEPYFKSEKHIIVSQKKETVDPPKKFFLLRWLQRKHVVLHIDVVERNPYVDNESSKYIEIIK